MKTPVALFVYNRIKQTQLTVEALEKNHGATESDLIIFSDAPKDSKAAYQVAAVREYIRNISGFRSISIVERTQNLGLAKSIITGISGILESNDSVIVLEDDHLTSPFFIDFMNNALGYYKDDNRVISIHGYVYPVEERLPETFFIRGADCWGWATWRRGWKLFNPDGKYLLNELKREKLLNQFNFDGARNNLHDLEAQISGGNDSWAIRWLASAFLAEKLTLYPGRSLVQNIGFDGSGIHCESSVACDTALSPVPVQVGSIGVEESYFAREQFKSFFRVNSPKRSKLKDFVRVLIPLSLLRILRKKGFLGRKL